MTKKEVKAKVKNNKKEVSKNKETKSILPNFLQDVEFNLYIMIYLLSIVVLLISGVLFYTSELLRATIAENNELELELHKYDHFIDYRTIELNFEEFSNSVDSEIRNILTLKNFLVEEGYQEVNLNAFNLYAKKSGECYKDQARDYDVCKSTIINYDAKEKDLINVVVGLEKSSN